VLRGGAGDLGAGGEHLPRRVRHPLERGDRIVAGGTTDSDGRVTDLGPDHLDPGTYRLRFDTSSRSGFFPEVVIAFVVDDDTHLHVPLLLSPHGYTTYRGS
jgi:5-hydroxyisourate hydrolase